MKKTALLFLLPGGIDEKKKNIPFSENIRVVLGTELIIRKSVSNNLMKNNK